MPALAYNGFRSDASTGRQGDLMGLSAAVTAALRWIWSVRGYEADLAIWG
jgi:hypothetical protein